MSDLVVKQVLDDCVRSTFHTEKEISEHSVNINASARNLNDTSTSQKLKTSNTQRPNSAPSGTHTVCSCYSGNFRTGTYQNPLLSRAISTEKYPSSHAYGIQTSGSLTKTPSIETPLGILRLSSSSSFEPVRLHSGTSTESFRCDDSLHKLNAMPALKEDENSSNDGANEISGRCKTKDRSKIKKSSRTRQDPEMVEIHLENEEKDESEERPADVSREKKGKLKTFSKFFKRLFPCTKSNKNEFNPDCLLDVTSCPNEK